MLLFGVAIFSYIMGNVMGLIDLYGEYSADFDEGDHLSKFLGTLKKFNDQ